MYFDSQEDGRFQTHLDLYCVNRCVACKTSHMLTVKQLAQLIHLGSWFTAIDLTVLTMMQPLGLRAAAHPVVSLGLLHMYGWQSWSIA